MAYRRIPNEDEAARWIAEGKPYAWIVDKIEEKYGVRIGQSTLSSLRLRRGLPRRIVRADTLIPWSMRPEHDHLYPVLMLRALARRRQGRELDEGTSRRLDAWLKQRWEDDTVVHYDPDLPQGWVYVPRRPGIDNDVIREPDVPTTKRKARD